MISIGLNFLAEQVWREIVTVGGEGLPQELGHFFDPSLPGASDRMHPNTPESVPFRNVAGLIVERLRFFQEAAPGLTLPDLGPGATVEIRGMHPEQPAISFVLPGTPHLVLHEAGGRLPLRPSLHTVHCHPGQEKVSLVHGAFSRLTRRYMPGVHREIPLAITVNGGPLCPYRAPAPVRDRLAALEKGG